MSAIPDSTRVPLVASSVNGTEWKIGQGFFRDFVKLPIPFIPGVDFAGTVAELRKGVTEFALGGSTALLFRRTSVGSEWIWREPDKIKEGVLLGERERRDHPEARRGESLFSQNNPSGRYS
jgi:NADPH:quinone reductase-like Zn-dependent oxidoreductase